MRRIISPYYQQQYQLKENQRWIYGFEGIAVKNMVTAKDGWIVLFGTLGGLVFIGMILLLVFLMSK